jgi:hypothetical protein
MIKTYFKHKSYYKPEGLITNYKAFGKVYKEMEADGTLTRLSEEYLSGTPVEGLSEGSYQ